MTVLPDVSRRSNIEIIFDILNASRAGGRKTQLMVRCNLSHPQLRKYLDLGVQRGLLTKSSEGGSEVYKTSAAGKEFAEHFICLKNMLDV